MGEVRIGVNPGGTTCTTTTAARPDQPDTLQAPVDTHVGLVAQERVKLGAPTHVLIGCQLQTVTPNRDEEGGTPPGHTAKRVADGN